MGIEKIPQTHQTGVMKEINRQHENPKITEEKDQTWHELFKGVLDNVNPKNRPTILDFQGLPPESTEDDILGWVEKELEIPKEYILDDGKTEESARFYTQLNHAYQAAKDFLTETLKYTSNEVNIGPMALNSKKDIFDLLNKTVFMSGNKGLSKAPLYCRIVKATLVASETLKHGVKTVQQNTKEFEQSLISNSSDNSDTPFIQMGQKDYTEKFYGASNSDLKGLITFRWKDQSKAMLRFITRVESNAKAALKDGIASRITVDEDQVKNLLPTLYRWLKNEMQVKYLNIQISSFMSEYKVRKIMSEFGRDILNNSLTIKEEKGDLTSQGNFETIKIEGVLNASQSESGGTSKYARQFEIQIVKSDNKNEKGKMKHDIFDVSKLVTARTRLDGYCPEGVFKEFVKNASKSADMSESKITQYLIGSKDSNIIKIKKKNNKKGESIYIAKSIYDRWNRFKWVDDKLIRDINYAKNN